MGVNIVNNGKPYFFRFDIAKEGGMSARITDYLKTRVNDNGKKVPVKWFDQGQVMNVHGLSPFIQGGVGHWTPDDNNDLLPGPDVVYRDWQGTPADVTDDGMVYYTLEDQFFCKQGQFKGIFGLRDSNGNVFSSVNIIFEIQGNDFRIHQTTEYYSSELEKMKAKFVNDTGQAVKDFNQQGSNAIQKLNADYNAKIQEAQNALTKATSDLNSFGAAVKTMDAQIKGQALATKPDLEQAKSDITKIVEDKTANLEKVAKANFSTVASLDQLKKDHATGADGYWITLDTKHLYIWSGNDWTDLGSAGIGDGTVPGKSIKDGSIFDSQVGTINLNKIQDSYADIGSVSGWGIFDAFSVDKANTAVTLNNGTNNRGLLFPVDISNIPNQTVYIDFLYYTVDDDKMDNNVNVYLARTDNSVINDYIVWSGTKGRKNVHIALTPDVLQKYSVGKQFKVLVACHGGSGTLDVSDFKATNALANRSLPDRIHRMDQLIEWNGLDYLNPVPYIDTTADLFVHNQDEIVLKTANNMTSKVIELRGEVNPNTTNYIRLTYSAINNDEDQYITAYLTNGEKLSSANQYVLGTVKANSGTNTIVYRLTPAVMQQLKITDKCSIFVGGKLNILRIGEASITILRGGESAVNVLNGLADDTQSDVTFGSPIGHLNENQALKIDGLKLVTSGESYKHNNGRLKHISLYAKNSGSTSMYVGKLDQHNLLVDSTKYTINYSEGFNELDFTEQNIAVENGDYVFIDCSTLGVYQPDAVHPLSSTTRLQDGNHVLSGQYSGNVFYTTNALAPFQYVVAPANSNQLADSLSKNISDNSKKVDEVKRQVKQVAVLSSPSGKKFRISVDDNGTLSAISTIPTNVQIFGNSLTCYYKDGFPALGASDQNHDWYHYVTDYIKSINSSAVIGPRRNVAQWEQGTDRDKQFDQLIKPNLTADADLVILQLGENVNTEALHESFATDVMNLFKNIKAVSPKAKIYFVGMWFCGWQDMIDSAQAACRKYDGTFVDIQDLANDPRNKAYIGEVVTLPDGTTKTLSSEGEANHPGDTGYKKIANRIIDSFDF